MRFLNLATVAIAALLVVPSTLLGQSLAEAAAKEKARRKALAEKGKKPARSYTDDDLGRAKGTNASFPSGPDAVPAEGDAAPKTDAAGSADSGTPEKTTQQKRAEESAAWRSNLDKAQKAAALYRDQVDKIQNDLNDTSGGFYSARRTTLLNLLDETKKKLADSEQQVADLEDQGRRSGY
jgi:hypothetical protein